MQEKERMNSVDIKAYVNSLAKNPRYSGEMLDLVEADLQSGLSVEETEWYTMKRYDIRQMRIISRCLREKVPEEVRRIILKEELKGEQMETVMELYESGAEPPMIDMILSSGITSPATMKKMYRSITEKIQAAEEAAAKEIFLLKEQLKEKESLLIKQQNELNETRSILNRLKKENEEVRKEWDFNMEHAVELPVQGRKLMLSVSETGRTRIGKELSAFFSRFAYKKNLDIVRLVSEKDLDPKQLIQVRSAICKGLTEKQLLILINSQKPAEQMEEIINIAVYENKQKGAC